MADTGAPDACVTRARAQFASFVSFRKPADPGSLALPWNFCIRWNFRTRGACFVSM